MSKWYIQYCCIVHFVSECVRACMLARKQNWKHWYGFSFFFFVYLFLFLSLSLSLLLDLDLLLIIECAVTGEEGRPSRQGKRFSFDILSILLQNLRRRKGLEPRAPRKRFIWIISCVSTFRLYEWSKKKKRKKRDRKVEGKVRKRMSEPETTAECSFDIHLVRGSRAILLRRPFRDGHREPQLCRGWNVITGKRGNFSFFKYAYWLGTRCSSEDNTRDALSHQARRLNVRRVLFWGLWRLNS